MSDKESSYEQSVDEKCRHDKSVDKVAPTPPAPQKARGTRDTINPLCPIGHLGKRKVGNHHRKSSGFWSEVRVANTEIYTHIGRLIDVILTDRTKRVSYRPNRNGDEGEIADGESQATQRESLTNENPLAALGLLEGSQNL